MPISIRVSPQEYESLKSVYKSRGIRNVSEFARHAMNRIINSDSDGGPGTNDLEGRVRVLDTRLSILRAISPNSPVSLPTTSSRRKPNRRIPHYSRRPLILLSLAACAFAHLPQYPTPAPPTPTP